MQYPAHTAFVAPARARPEIWRLVVGVGVIVLVYALWSGVMYLGLLAVSGQDGAARWLEQIDAASGPTGTLLLLATFLGMALGPMLAVRLLHRRSISSLFGPLRRMARDFAIALGICLLVYAASAFLPSTDFEPVANLDLLLWAGFLPLALVAVLVQTGAEEVLFRGYLQQQLAARFSSTLVWMLLPSALFAIGHYQPQIMGDNAWLIVLAVFVFALLAADLTAVTGNIGAAWGFHFANNSVAILLVAMDGPLSGLALYTAPIAPSAAEIAPLIWLDIGTAIATWVAIRIAVTRGR